MYFSGLDQRLCDSVCGRCSLLPSLQCHGVSGQCGERTSLHKTFGANHATKHPRYQKSSRNSQWQREHLWIHAGTVNTVTHQSDVPPIFVPGYLWLATQCYSTGSVRWSDDRLGYQSGESWNVSIPFLRLMLTASWLSEQFGRGNNCLGNQGRARRDVSCSLWSSVGERESNLLLLSIITWQLFNNQPATNPRTSCQSVCGSTSNREAKVVVWSSSVVQYLNRQGAQ
jgi:hypothetical protein